MFILIVICVWIVAFQCCISLAVLLRIIGVGLLQIDLYDFFSLPVSRVVDVDSDFIALLAKDWHLDEEDKLFERKAQDE